MIVYITRQKIMGSVGFIVHNAERNNALGYRRTLKKANKWAKARGYAVVSKTTANATRR